MTFVNHTYSILQIYSHKTPHLMVSLFILFFLLSIVNSYINSTTNSSGEYYSIQYDKYSEIECNNDNLCYIECTESCSYNTIKAYAPNVIFICFDDCIGPKIYAESSENVNVIFNYSSGSVYGTFYFGNSTNVQII